MNGQASFCEVFITDARVRESDVLGKLNEGWSVTRTTLLYERVSATERPARGLVFVASGEKAGQLDRIVGEVIASRDRATVAFHRECGAGPPPDRAGARARRERRRGDAPAPRAATTQ